MHLHLFTIHDSKAESFLPPFYVPTVAVALRSFGSAANDPETKINQYPGDYTLFELGKFDQDTARFELLKTPVNHGLAISFKTNNPAGSPTIASFREAFAAKEASSS